MDAWSALHENRDDANLAPQHSGDLEPDKIIELCSLLAFDGRQPFLAEMPEDVARTDSLIDDPDEIFARSWNQYP